MSHNIDKIIYINLEYRVDRKNEIESELNKMELPFERYSAIKQSGGVGCLKSHLNVLKLAKERNYKNVLIFEDDFTFLVSKEEFEKQLNQFFDNVKEFDVCMLSYNLSKSEPDPKFDFVGRVLQAQTASGYLVNGHYLDKLISLYEFAVPMFEATLAHWTWQNDQCWHELQRQGRWFYFIQRIGKQRDGFSDNSNEFMSYNC